MFFLFIVFCFFFFLFCCCFFFNDTATTEIYTLSLHDAFRSQLVTIDQPVLTGAKMALGVVALNATALIGISLIGMAIGAAAERAKED